MTFKYVYKKFPRLREIRTMLTRRFNDWCESTVLIKKGNINRIILEFNKHSYKSLNKSTEPNDSQFTINQVPEYEIYIRRFPIKFYIANADRLRSANEFIYT